MECEVYVPPYDNVTIYFLKDILARRKAYITVDDVKTMHIPQYKNLSVEKILDFALDKPRIVNYLPDEPDLQKVPKQWLVNVMAAVLGDAFKDWVIDQIEDRNMLMADKKEVHIAMDPQMAAKFAASSHVSSKSSRKLSVPLSFFLYSDKGSVREYVEDLL